MPVSRLRRDEDGFALLEVIVSAALLAVMVVAVFTTFDVVNRVSGQEKARAVAGSLAQREVELMRSLPVATLAQIANTPQTPTTKTVDDIQYTITRRAEWLARGASATSCQSDSAGTDYMKIVSTVQAPSTMGIKPVTLTSVVAPPAHSFGADKGSLAILVQTATTDPQPGVNVTLSGPGVTTSRTTDATGCAFFGEQTTGDYTVTLSKVGMVDPTGNATPSKVETIAPEATTTDTFLYDTAATRTVRFKTLAVNATTGAIGTTLVDSAWNSVMFAPPGTLAPPAPFPKPASATRQTTITGTNLFPFTSAYAVYAGNCTDAQPATAVASGAIPALPGAALASDTADAIAYMPPVVVTVRNSNDTANVSGAKIWLTAKNGNCTGSYQVGGSSATTDSTGRIPTSGAVGVPFGQYDLCVEAGGKIFKETYAAAVGTTPVKGIDNSPSAGVTKTVKMTTANGSCP
jgi:Flp pilus assembly pilin Flp